MGVKYDPLLGALRTTDVSSGGGTTPDADATTKGKIQLAGDLGGTAALPTVKSRTVTKTVGVTGSGADYECDGTADDVQFQAALDAINVLGGGELRVRKGTYTCSSVVNLYSNITLSIENGAVIQQRTANTHLFQAIGSLGSELINIHIIGPGSILKSMAGSGYAVSDVLAITGGDGAATATVTSISSAGVIYAATGTGGSNYVNSSAVATTGGTGTGALVNTTTVGVIQSIAIHTAVINYATVSYGGTGYTAGDTITISGGSGTATATVASVSSGVVTGLTLVGGGTSYVSSSAGVAVTGGTGTGLLIDTTVIGAVQSVTINTGINNAVRFEYVNNSSIQGIEAGRAQSSCIYLYHSNYNMVRDCIIHDSTLHLMTVKASSHNVIANNLFYNEVGTPGAGQGLYLYDGSSDYNLVDGNYLHDIVESGIRIEGSYNKVCNNHVQGCGRAGLYQAVYGSTLPAGGNQKNNIINNTFSDCNRQNNGHAHVWIQHRDSVVQGNNIYGGGSYDSVSDGIIVNALGVVVHGNNIRQVCTGIKIAYPNATIAGNNVQQCYNNGIEFKAAASGSNYNLNCRYNTVSNNIVKDNGLATVSTYSGIRVGASGASTVCSYNIIANNIITDNQVTQTTALSASAGTGQKVVTVTATVPPHGDGYSNSSDTLNFFIGMNVTITDGVNTESNIIASIDSDTQFTMVNNLANTYAAGSVTGIASQKYGIIGIAATGGVLTSNTVVSNVLLGNATSPMDMSADTLVQISHNRTA